MTAIAPHVPNRAAMQDHLNWLVGPVLAAHPDLRLEIAWGSPESGPCNAKTFRLDHIEAAADFALSVNSTGCNVYVGATLKRADAPATERTASKHAVLATCLPVDIDAGFRDGVLKLASIAKPQRVVVTGVTPERRGQVWIRHAPSNDIPLWTEVNRRSVHFSGGDRNALGAYRLMRLGGTISFPPLKKKSKGYLVETTTLHSCEAPEYSLHDLLNALPAVESASALKQSKVFGTGGGVAATLGNNLDDQPPVNRTNVALVQSMLNALNDGNASEYNQWLRVGLALHAFDPGEIGLALWVRFSQRHPEKAGSTDFDKLWAGFKREYHGRKITIGTLWAEAKSQGWSPPCSWDRTPNTALKEE
jgi:hypothetical protein